MGKILVTQYFCCKSYAEALEISKAFDSLRIKHYGLGRRQTISFKRSIQKHSAKSFSHMLKVYFWLKGGDFCDYGYVDPLSLKCYPELPQLLKSASDEEKLNIIFEYEEKRFDAFSEMRLLVEGALNLFEDDAGGMSRPTVYKYLKLLE